MDDKLKIHLQIDRERYPLVINREEEIFYREAAKMQRYAHKPHPLPGVGRPPTVYALLPGIL